MLPAYAAEYTNKTMDTQSSFYVVAQNSPVTLNLPRGAFLPTKDGYCVSFIKEHGFEAFKGNAYEWSKYINSDIGWIGSAVLLDEGPYQHLALIIGTEGGYNLVEQNYEGLYIITYRTIPFDYPKIVGFVHL